MFVLRCDRRTRDQPVVPRLRYECVEKKLRRALHYRIDTREKLFVAGEFVVLPEMRAEPRAASGPEAPEWSIDRRRLSPQIGVVMTHPTVRTVLHTRRARSVLHQLGNHPQ